MIMKVLFCCIILCQLSLQGKITPKRYEVDSKEYGYAIPTPLVVEDPKKLEYVKSFLNIWDNTYKTQDMTKYKTIADNAIKTVIAITPMKLNYVVPMGTLNPLLEPKNEDLAHTFMLDCLSMDTIDFEDPNMKTPEGVKIMSLSGKYLVFKKDPTTYKYTVNGVEIEMHNILPGEPNVMIISDFLFNQYENIKKAYQIEMYKRIPKIPYVLTMPTPEVDVSQFVNIWEKRREQIMPVYRNEETAPKTIVTGTPYKYMKLLPEGYTSPLAYPGYEQVTDDFILDSVSTDALDFTDPRITTPEGVMIKTMSEKYLIFKKDTTTNKYTVNDIEIESHTTLDNDTNVVLINGFLFSLYDEVKNAMYEMKGGDVKTDNTTTEYKLPAIPEDLKVDDMYTQYAADLLDLWKQRITKVGVDKVGTAPKTVITPSMYKWRMVLPEGTTNPLIYPGYEKMADYFIKDSLSEESINFNDPKLTTPEGITIKTKSGKDLVFKKYPDTDNITCNGVKVEKEMLLTTGTNLVITNDFLFNQYMYIKNALEDMNRNIPEIPTDIIDPTTAGIDCSGIVNLWENRLKTVKKTPETKTTEIKPKTIVATTQYKWMKMIPADATNPLFMTGYEKFVDDYILDSISGDVLDYSDPKLMTPEGITLKSLSGKDLVFMKYPDTGKLTVNGIPVEEKKFFDDKTTVCTINNFLFDNYMYMKKAIDAYFNQMTTTTTTTKH